MEIDLMKVLTHLVNNQERIIKQNETIITLLQGEESYEDGQQLVRCPRLKKPAEWEEFVQAAKSMGNIKRAYEQKIKDKNTYKYCVINGWYQVLNDGGRLEWPNP